MAALLSRFRVCSVVVALLLVGASGFSVAAQVQNPTEVPGGQTVPAVQHAGGEANLVLPDLGTVTFQGINGRTLLMAGLGVCVLGLIFGLVIYNNLKNLPVHRSMIEI